MLVLIDCKAVCVDIMCHCPGWIIFWTGK